MPRMIFHAPYPLRQGASASAKRPVQMRLAFEEMGYDVFDLTGTSAERKRKFAILRDQLKAGSKFDFMYSESATIPAMIGDANHFPHLLLDARIFQTLEKFGVPTSVFYRDLYWVYDEYEERVGKPLAAAMRALYRYELAVYSRYAHTIFVPSLEMANEIPQLRIPKVEELPPGSELADLSAPPLPLNMFYVGGIGAHYNLHKLVRALQRVPEATLTICTNEDQWKAVEDEYAIREDNIRVVHARGSELDEYYSKANVAVIAVEPTHYWSFAVPFKLYEYVGRGKPIIATKGTLTATIVERNEWGWTTQNDEDALVELLTELSQDGKAIEERTRNVISDRENNTWLARAQTVRDLFVRAR